MAMNEQFPAARLAVAGYASLGLLAWIAFMPGSLPPIFFRFGRASSAAIIVTATISLFIIVILTPVLWSGPRGNRWLAVLVILFPFITLSVAGLWLGVRAVLR